MSFSELVKRVIELGTAITDYWDAELPKRHPKYPLVEPGEEDPPPPPEQAELQAMLRSRPPGDVYKLLALVDVGRRVCPAAAFSERARAVAKERGDVEWAIARIAGFSPPVEDLADGLRELVAARIDLDSAQPAPV